MSIFNKTTVIAVIIGVLGLGGIGVFAFNKFQNSNTAKQSSSSSVLMSNSNSQLAASNPISSTFSQDSIKTKITELQTKYQKELSDLASKKDELGFIARYKQYRSDLTLLVPLKASLSANTSANSATVSAESKLEAQAKKEYNRALSDIEAKKPYLLNNPTKKSKPKTQKK